MRTHTYEEDGRMARSAPSFYGRKPELAILEQWIAQERCRIVNVLGVGGIGKSALVVTCLQRIAGLFEKILFCALHEAPSCTELLADCLQALSPHPLFEIPVTFQDRLYLLLQYLQEQRVMLVLNNLEVLLQDGTCVGHYIPGYEEYAYMLLCIGETAHQSCLLLTSREKPANLTPLEGTYTPIRSLPLAGLDTYAATQLLKEQGLIGTPEEHLGLIKAYAGNPRALRSVAETIRDLFVGEIDLFRTQGIMSFGQIKKLHAEHISRLSALERTVLYWLAIAHEALNIEELQELFAIPLPQKQLVSIIDALHCRFLTERGPRFASFTLHSVLQEYVVGMFIQEAVSEIKWGELSLLTTHGFCLASASEDMQWIQERLIVIPILVCLIRTYPEPEAVEKHLLSLLAKLHQQTEGTQGYGLANLMTLLRMLRGQMITPVL
jgi:hypothetical protein